jgi:hypothetical protein
MVFFSVANPFQLSYTVKKAPRNFDVDNVGANQTTQGSENSCFHVVWFCATVVNIGVWRIPRWLFYSVGTDLKRNRGAERGIVLDKEGLQQLREKL